MNIEDKALDIILDHTASSEWEDVCDLTWNTNEVQELLIKALNTPVVVSSSNICTDTSEECKYSCSGLCKERC